jgi:hypothetical protein
MLGVDYSAQSVELARRIDATRDAVDAEEDGEGEEADSEEPQKKKQQQQQEDEKEEEKKKRIPPVNFLEWNLLTGPLSPTDPASPLHYAPSSSEKPLFDIVLDKGTFDAISLSATSSPTETHPCEIYRQRLLQLLNPHGGIFLVTSCNWTEKELRGWFEDERDGELTVVGRVEYPTFTFGGMKGQTISTLCFRRG